MLKKLLRLIHRYQLVRQIKTEQPELKRLSARMALKCYVENRLADQDRQQAAFEDSIMNPAAYGGFIKHPEPPSKLLAQAMDYLPTELKPVPSSTNGESNILTTRSGALYIRVQGLTPLKLTPLGPLALAVKSVNFWEKSLIKYQEATSQGVYNPPGMEECILFKIAESKDEVARLTQMRNYKDDQ